MSNRFFIVGCQRSGTTLLRLILECHSQLACYDELAGYDVLRQAPPATNGTRDWVGFKMPMLTEQLADPVFEDYKLAPFPNSYAREPLLFMVRDVHDTVASMVALRVGRLSNWLERWGIPALAQKLETRPQYERRLRPVLDAFATRPHFPLAQAATYWSYKTAALADYQQRGFPTLRVDYQQLVTDPRRILGDVCEFLHVPWEDALLDHPARPHSEIMSNGKAIGGTDPQRAIDHHSVGRGQQFSESERRIIAEAAEAANDALRG